MQLGKPRDGHSPRPFRAGSVAGGVDPMSVDFAARWIAAHQEAVAGTSAVLFCQAMSPVAFRLPELQICRMD